MIDWKTAVTIAAGILLAGLVLAAVGAAGRRV